MSTLEMLIAMIYAFIGVVGAFSLLVFSYGFGIYVARLGTERRIEGIRTMQKGVSIMIATVLLVGLVRFLE